PGLTTVASGGAAVFDQRASFNAGPPRVEVPLPVDPNSLPRVQVSGAMHQNGTPLAGSQYLYLRAYDSAGAVLLAWNQLVDVSIDDGTYQFSRVLPPTATRLAVEGYVGTPVLEIFSGELTDLVIGPNQRTFDIDYVVPTATVSGTLTNGVSGLPGPLAVNVIVKNALGSSLGATPVIVNPDPVTGAYSFTTPLQRVAASVEASVQVGQYGETFRSALVSVVDHTASLDLSGVFAPAQVTVSGDYLDELGAPIGTPSQLGIWFFDGNDVFLTSRGAMVPGVVGAGAYSVGFTAPAGAAKAEVYVNAGVQGESFRSPRVPITQLTAIDLDVVLNPVRLHVTGTFTDGAGVPLTGTVPMDIQFKDSTGMVVTGQVGSVVPDSVTGAYAIDFVGPRNATSATVRALVGVNGESRAADVPALTHGNNEFVFNVGFSPPVVTFTGRMTGVGGAPLAGPIPVYVQGHDVNFETPFGAYRYVTPDAEGDYSFTIVMPSTVVSVNAEAQIGTIVEWFHTAEVPVVDGNNTVVLDADYRPPSATISGVLVSAPGVPLAPPFVPGAISIGVTSYNANGDVVRYVQPSITPGAGGAYSFPVSLPRTATSIEVRAFISGENFVQTFAGFAPGVQQDLTFDVAYNPPRLNVSGVARKDGQFATGQVRVDIRRYSSPTVWTDSTMFLAIGAAGAYSRSNVILPVGTIKADVTVKLSNGSNSFSTTADVLVPGELRPVVVDFDDVQTTVTVSGTLQLLGAAAQPGNLYISAFDSNDVPLTVAEWYKTVTPGPNGEFSGVTFVVPQNTARAVVYSFLTTPGWNGNYYASQQVPGIVPFTDTATGFDVDAKGVRITGSLVDAGNRVTLDNDATDIAFDVTYHTPVVGVGSGRTAFYEADNSFLLELFVPVDATSVDLGITNAGTSQPATIVTPLVNTVTDYRWDVDTHPVDLTEFILFGTLTDGGVPVTTQPALTFEVVGYSYVDWDTPYQEVWRREFTTVPFPTGNYGVGWVDVPRSVTLIRATVKVDGADDGWSRGYTDFVVGGTNQRTFDIELGASRLRYRGNTILDQCPAPLVFYREFWTFTSQPTLPYDWETNTWPGGTLAGKVLVIPD
ncbi:MAG: hypothetical protein WCC60_00830, partial [Ilumatobacteraceae bacterium]